MPSCWEPVGKSKDLDGKWLAGQVKSQSLEKSKKLLECLNALCQQRTPGGTMEEFLASFRTVQADAYETAKRLGFEDQTANPFYVPTKLALIGTEIAEAIESHRKGDDNHLPVDLADIVLRTMDLASGLGIDLAKAILEKAELNKGRTFRNGNLRY